MIYYDNKKFIKEDYIARVYIDGGNEPLESWIHDKEWFEEIQKRVFNISKEEIEYEDIIFTEEQYIRLNEINDYGKIAEYYINYVFDYVINGALPDGEDYPLTIFQLKKENRELKQRLSLI